MGTRGKTVEPPAHKDFSNIDRSMAKSFSFMALCGLVAAQSAPKITKLAVLDRLPQDGWRPNVPVWKIEGTLCLENCTTYIVHRQDEELRTLESLLKKLDFFHA